MKKRLSDLGINIVGGQIISRVISDETKHDPIVEENVKTIVSKSVSEGFIDDNNLIVNNYKSSLDERRKTKEGDIVVKLSLPFKAAYIDKEHVGLFVSSFCAIIRNVKDIERNYLLAYLNSELVADQIDLKNMGMTTIAISNQVIYDLEIRIPSKEKQEEIGLCFINKIQKKIIMEKIIKLENEKLAELIYELEETDEK